MNNPIRTIYVVETNLNIYLNPFFIRKTCAATTNFSLTINLI